MKARRAGPLSASASILASVAVVSGVLASGLATSSPAAAATTTSTVPVRASADLVIWADADRAKILLPFAQQFGKRYGISVAVTADAGNLEGDFITATEAGKGPDIVVGAHDWIGDMVADGTLAPIAMPTMEQKLFDPVTIKAVTYNGEIYGVPYAIENLALFRHPNLTPQAPTTFQQMISEGKALVTAGKAKIPFCVEVDATGDPYNFEPFYTSAGGYLFGTLPNGNWNPSSVGVGLAGSLEFAKFLEQYGQKGSTPIFSTSMNYTDATGGFINGQCAFYLGGPWAVGAGSGSIHPGTFALSAIPGFAGMGPARPFLGVQSFMVSSKAKNMALADQFVLDYVASPAVQEALFNVEPRPAALLSVQKQEIATSSIARGFFAAGKLGQPMPSIPAMDQVWTPLGVAEANIINGQAPATQITEARAAILKAIASEK
jgi:arabinogalactan oligomer / maltooligosaccharide transport system substrate-binding protein